MNLEKDAFAGLVTSMAFLTDAILLVGHGPWLKVFDVQTGVLLQKSLVLPANRIHRLVLEPSNRAIPENGIRRSRVMVYGAKNLAVLEIEVGDNENADQKIYNTNGNRQGEQNVYVRGIKQYGPFPDWIQDTQWLFEDDKMEEQAKQIAIAFAHNFVDIYDITTEIPTQVLRIQCEERCILYSARFFGHTLSTLYLGAGTVFNEVHVWKMTDKNDEGYAPVLHRLVGHDGVIFGIRFSDDGKFLVSVSDDRTIRIWSLANAQQKYHVIFGHTARIWDCHIVGRYLVSVSEDTTCRVWNNPYLQDGEDGEDTAMDCLACWEGHMGKNVWSCAVSPNNRLVATGGQDSGVRLWSLRAIQENHIESEADLTAIQLPQLDSYAPALQNANEFIRNFVLVGYNDIAMFTNEGYLLRYENPTGKWTTLWQDNDYRNYAMMKSCQSGKLIVSGSLYGHLSVVHSESAFPPIKIKVFESKVFNTFISESKVIGVFYIVTVGVEDGFCLHRFDIRDLSKPQITIVHHLQQSLLKTTIICTAICEEYKLLICGSRESALLVYRIPGIDSDVVDSEPPLSAPILQLRRTHGRQAVSSVTLRHLLDTAGHGPGLSILTTGRDGCFIEYRLTNITSSVSDTEEKLDIDADAMDVVDDSEDEEEKRNEDSGKKQLLIEKVYKNRVTKGWAEGSFYMDGQLYILGFYRKRFFVFNVSKGFEMLSIACGGANRTWHFLNNDARLAECTFAFFRKNKVNVLFRKALPSSEIFEESIQTNFHGRDVRAIKFLGSAIGSKEKYNNMPVVIATGGEDTLLRLSQYVPGKLEGRLVNLRTVRKHSSVIKSIACSIGRETLLFTSGAGEELRCWKLDSHAPQGTTFDFDPGRDLLDMSCLEWAASPMVSAIKETRIMDMSVFPIEAKNGLHILAAAYSDSTTRLWLFDEAVKQFFLIADGVWHMKCLLQIRHLLLPDSSGGQGVIIVTTATDGKLAFWDTTIVINQFVTSYKAGSPLSLTKLSEPFYSYQAHLSGVNAIDIQEREDGNFWVASGGEDNALAVNWLSLEYNGYNDNPVSVTGRSELAKISSAHASSVTGVHVVDDLVLSVSTDQRLNVWKVDTNHHLSLSLYDSHYIDVPDPSAMDVTKLGDTLLLGIAGIGFQMLKTKVASSA